jgi:hypothetical protein
MRALAGGIFNRDNAEELDEVVSAISAHFASAAVIDEDSANAVTPTTKKRDFPGSLIHKTLSSDYDKRFRSPTSY